MPWYGALPRRWPVHNGNNRNGENTPFPVSISYRMGGLPVLVNFGEPGHFDITPWADRVQLIDAKYSGAWELPALGVITAPGEGTDLGLADALTTWFGSSKAA